MWGTIAGLIAGFFVAGGWWSLFAFCAIISIGIGSWRIFGAYRRLESGQEHERKFSDAYNITLTNGTPDPEVTAARIVESGHVPRPTFKMYVHACTWEFITMAAFASLARLTKLLLFAV